MNNNVELLFISPFFHSLFLSSSFLPPFLPFSLPLFSHSHFSRAVQVPSILKAIYDEVLKHRFTLENASNKSKATKQHFRRCQLCRAFHSDVDVNSKTDVDDADGKSAAPPSPSTSPSLTPCLYKVLEAIPADKGVFRLGASRSRNVDEVGEEEEGREANGVGVLRPIFGAKNGKKVRRHYDDDDDEEMSEDDDVGDDDGEDGDDIDEKRGVTPSYEELLALIAPSLKMFQKGGCKGDLHLRLLGQSIFMDKTYATSSKLSKKVSKQVWLYACSFVCVCVCECVYVCVSVCACV